MRSRGISPKSATHDCITHAAILSRSAVPAGYIASAFCLTSRGMVITSPVSTLFQYSSFAAATCSGEFSRAGRDCGYRVLLLQPVFLHRCGGLFRHAFFY